MPANPIIEQLIVKVATDHGLPPALVRAMVMVESGGDTFATRYEPGFYEKYIRNDGSVKAFGACSLQTERVLRATSFGLMQVMGQVARERGYLGPFLTSLCDPDTGLQFGCLHLAAFRRRFAGLGWDAVCAAYNGGAGAVRGQHDFRNPEYPAKVLKALGGVWPE